MRFISRSTKVRGIVASSLTAIALITLIMLSSLLTIKDASKTLMCFIYTVSLMLIMMGWAGIYQIRVFNDYKCQKKHLCADGVIQICISVLLLITSILFGCLQATTALDLGYIQANGATDIRIFIIAFLAVMLAWKTYVAIIAIKEKRFNMWADILYPILYLALTVLGIVSLFLVKESLVSLGWGVVGVSWGLIVLTVFDTIFSYVIKEPEYLETPRAIELYEKEEEEAELRKKRAMDVYDDSFTESRLEAKLRKLQTLKEEGLITAPEYSKRRKELLDRGL